MDPYYYVSEYWFHEVDSPVAFASSAAPKAELHPADIVIFVLVLLISLGIGIYFALAGEKQKTTKEYLMGNRNLKLLPVSTSMFMSFISAILILGNSAEIYLHGTQFWISTFGAAATFLFSGYFLVPVFYPLKLTSSFEYFQMRFGKRYVKLTGTILQILSQIIYMGIAMYAPATALEAVTKIPAWASILVCGVVATIYTTVGGMKAVVWTDVFQGGVYLLGLILILALGSSKVGGIAEIWRISYEHGRINFFPKNGFSFDPTIRHTFWILLFGQFFASIGMATGQTTVQRYSSLPTQKKAFWSVVLNFPAIVIFYTMTCLCGLAVFAYYAKQGCDPLRAGYIKNPNQLLPYFVVTVLNIPGIPGMFLAVLFSGALSSLSSSLNAISAIVWKDLLEVRYSHIPESRKALATKCLVFIFGLIAIIMAFLAEIMGGHVMQATTAFMSSVGSPLFAMLFLGAFIPWTNAIGVVVGGITGVVFSMFVAIGGYVAKYHRSTLPTIVTNCSLAINATVAPIATNPPPDSVFPLFRLSYMTYAIFGVLVTIVTGLIVSVLTGVNKLSETDPRLLVPVGDKLCCCFNEKCRAHCCGGAQSIPFEEDGVDNTEKMEKVADGSNLNFSVKNGCIPSNKLIGISYIPCEKLPNMPVTEKSYQGTINEAFQRTEL